MNINQKYKLYLCGIMLIFFTSNEVVGQTNELGVFWGRSFFHGDIGYASGEQSVFNTRPVIGFQFKRNFNYHFGFNICFNKGQLYANDKYSNDIFVLERNLHFQSKITEIGLIAEFNFRPYMSRDSDYKRTPFIFSGISKFFFNPEIQHLDGNWYSLRPLGTEGQDTDLRTSTDLYKLNGIAIPFGFGYKFSIHDYITLSVNYGWRITFTDYIDDVSEKYVDPSGLSELGEELANQANNLLPVGFQRGNPNNNDKYGFLGFSIIYSIKDPKSLCENITN